MSDYTNYYNAAETALANFLGTDDIDQDTINLVANCCVQAIEALPNASYYEALLEKSSSYVQCDLDELELADYVGELENQLEAFGVF